MRRISVGAAVTAAVLLLAGCGDSAAEATDNPEFGSCIEDAELALTGSEEWQQSEWADFFSQPEALACAIDDLDEEDRHAALTEAFPRYWEDDASERAYWIRLEAIDDYAATTTEAAGESAALEDTKSLIESLEWQETADFEQTAVLIAVSVLDAQDDLPGLDAFLDDVAADEPTEGRYLYGLELKKTAAGAIGRRAFDLETTLVDSLDYEGLVP